MLCRDFENRLTDYLDGALDTDENRFVAEHALRCPVCHETLLEVKATLQACRFANVPPPPRELEARILQRTTPGTAMTCGDFEAFLTDYLDGFLPAPLYHRWERHAAVCEQCTELPGDVVRAIGACYTYISEDLTVPIGLNERILQATLGTVRSEEVRAPLGARIASRLRLWLDPIVSPQLATVASMLLVAVFVLTNTVSADGSIGGVYRASLMLAEQSRSASTTGGLRDITDGLRGLIGGQKGTRPSSESPARNGEQQSPEGSGPEKNESERR